MDAKTSNNGLLEDKTCIVTGGTRGIGKAIALAFLEQNAYVVIIGRSSAEAPKWCEEYIECGALSYACLDVADSASVRRLFTDIKRERGALDVLINNAGIEYNELIAFSDEAHMREMFEVNVFGTVIMTQYASRIMRQSKTRGAIINISSGVALKGNPGQAVYGATKGAVIAFTKSASKELARDGIRVNSIAPGLVETDMMRAADQSKLQPRIDSVALGRLAQPSEIADACVFLASDKASYVTGQILLVDGGAAY